MPKIVPSDIVKYIDLAIRNASDIQKSRSEFGIETAGSPKLLETLAKLLEELDEALLPQSSDDYLKFLIAKAAIQSTVRTAENTGSAGVKKVSGLKKENPVITVRRLLENCSDEAVPSGTADLPFIADTEYREQLRLDLASIDRFLNEREWKAAIVLGGSLIEAFLCYAIGDYLTSNNTTISALKSKNKVHTNANTDINKWVLNTYISVTHNLNLIKSSTKDACLLAKDYRNLIHPGVAIRKNQNCSRAGALSVAGALHAVIEDLS